MFKVIILTLLLAYSVNANFWSPCSDLPNALPPNRIVSPACPEGAQRCTATRGQPLNADVYITPNQAHARLDVQVTAFIFGVGINLPPSDDNACNDLHRDGVFHGCPATPNAEHVWKISIQISSLYPAFSDTRVRFQLLENGVTVGCSDVMADLA